MRDSTFADAQKSLRNLGRFLPVFFTFVFFAVCCFVCIAIEKHAISLYYCAMTSKGIELNWIKLNWIVKGFFWATLTMRSGWRTVFFTRTFNSNWSLHIPIYMFPYLDRCSGFCRYFCCRLLESWTRLIHFGKGSVCKVTRSWSHTWAASREMFYPEKNVPPPSPEKQTFQSLTVTSALSLI